MSKVSQKVIGVLNRKGGSGKTVTAIYLAVILHKMGVDVGLYDADPNMSATQWARHANFPFACYTQAGEAIKRKHKILVIDSAPNDERSMGIIARQSTHVVIPCSPSPVEIEQLTATLKLLAATGFEGDGGIVLTSVPNRSRGEATQKELVEAGFGVLGMIPNLVAYKDSYGSIPENLDDYTAVLNRMGVL